MEEGFVLGNNLSNVIPSVWIEGAPEPSFWTGIKVSGRTKRRVQTFRCTACGHLDSFALAEWPEP
jgi:hypothetical protein